MLIPANQVTVRSWLSWYCMLAGAAGMWISLSILINGLQNLGVEVRPVAGLVFFGMLGLFLLVAWAGVLLAMESPWGPPLATALQWIQLPAVTFHGWQWMFFAGGYLLPSWTTGSGFGFDVGAKALLRIAWGGADEGTQFGLNLVPLVILWMLRRKLPLGREASSPVSDIQLDPVTSSLPRLDN